MLHLLWVLIVGAIIGVIGQMIVGRDMPGGWIGNIVAGLLGAWIGGNLLGTWGPVVGGMAILPAIIGAVVLVFIVSLVIGVMSKKRRGS